MCPRVGAGEEASFTVIVAASVVELTAGNAEAAGLLVTVYFEPKVIVDPS
jgi:hypothetical protein